MLQLFLTNIIINKAVGRKKLNFVFWEQEISISCNTVVARSRLEGFYVVIVLILTFWIWPFKF